MFGMFKTVSDAAGGAMKTAADDINAGEKAIVGGAEAIGSLFGGRGGHEKVTVINREGTGGDRVIVKETASSGGHGKLSSATGNILHTGAVMATDAADIVYAKPVVLGADLIANVAGQEQAQMFHDAEKTLHDSIIHAADSVIVKPAMMGVDMIESMFGGGGHDHEVVIIHETAPESKAVVSDRDASVDRTYKYTFSGPEPRSASISSSNTIISSESSNQEATSRSQTEVTEQVTVKHITITYDATYPLTAPIVTPQGITYRIAIIADLDKDSNISPDVFASNLRKGYLIWNPNTRKVSVSWDKESLLLTSTISEHGKGMELSELNIYNGKLYACDDKTGILYEIDGNEVKPFVKLYEGDGTTDKPMKTEWGTVKDGILYIGGHGKVTMTPGGEVVNINEEWVKKVLPTGDVYHTNWHKRFEAIRRALGISLPGYVIHEAAAWSDIHQKWFFLPRKVCKTAFCEEVDAVSGNNLLISTDDKFEEFKIVKVGELNPRSGFSSFKFIPGTNDEVIVAIKSREDTETASFITVFTIEGEILMEETQFSDLKYEGIEFI